MSGLSKTERQRAKIKRLKAHLETWQAWARALLDAPPDASGPAMRQQIKTVWEATRDVLDEGPARHITVTANIDGEPLRMVLDLEGLDFTGSPADLAIAQTFFSNAQAGLERRFEKASK